jgi:superfamily II DNA or RNA helicase
LTAPALKYAPRRWQCKALEAWKKASRRGIVEVVTGGGKTVFAELCMAEVLKSEPDVQFLILVPTTSIMDQWFVSLIEEFGVAEADIVTWSGRSKPRRPRLFNIMVINTGRTVAELVREAGPTMLIVDECHRAASDANSKALQGNYIASLGMSATPEREHDDRFEKILQPALGDIIYRYDLNEASDDGIVSPFDLLNVRVELCHDEQERYNRISAQIARLLKKKKPDAEVAEKLEFLMRKRARVAAMARMRVPVAAKLVDDYRGVRAMIFHEDIAEAERLAYLLKERGHSVAVYHSQIAAPVRRDNLRLYRRGAFDVLVSCRALDEGINIPETQLAVIVSATASTRQRIQRLGRVLRPAKGKSHATIYTLYATDIEEKRLAREYVNLTSAREVTWHKARVRDA